MKYKLNRIVRIILRVRGDNLKASLLFLFFSWGALFFWDYLIHSNADTDVSTLLDSVSIYILIAMSSLLIVLQVRDSILQDLITITIGLALIFAYSVIVFNILLNIIPDIDDFIFYYEFFLLVYFTGLPMYLCLKIILF
ncbi:TPA: transporter [Serratia marcescens]|nr:transporter [Klebsiella aerogenes]HEM7555778.1 transporter [Serratia marcescens]